MTIDLIFTLEILGTIVFAISGAIVAFEKKMDIFGVAILGMTTAIGGGLIRDLILGIIPPTCFVKPIYAIVGLVTSLICFIKPIRNRLKANNIIILIIDSIGLGIFTVVGETIAISMYNDNVFLILFVSVLTGVGGSVLRDVFAMQLPTIFVKNFYATASLIGAIIFYAIYHLANLPTAMFIGAFVTTVLRLFAAKYRWNLPK